ncbi:MAG: shikimate dehydrogenase [Coriobacteriia bacterium]|nr:shikimate dehydrogenase [Coriobacteriia bacterium]
MAVSNIALTGLPGSGKTSLGYEAGQVMDMPFIDIDTQIEESMGLSINEIFAEYGEAYFRELESEQVLKASKLSGAIIATGGGAVTRQRNMEALQKTSLVVFIDRPVEDIAADIDSSSRPLLAGQQQAIFQLARQRDALYRQSADLVLDNSGGQDEALAALLAIARSVKPNCPFAVVGDPVMHSLSPLIHNTILEGLGLEAGYESVWLSPKQLEGFVALARGTQMRGFNVTIPHKQTIIPFLDGLDVSAERAQAVNTVVAQGGRLIGHNTDMGGFQAALHDAGSHITDRRIAVIGTGGAASALALLAADEGAETITLLGRNLSKADNLASSVYEQTGVFIQTGGLEASDLNAVLTDVDILVNATPLGMHSYADDFEQLGFVQALPAKSLVFDLVYQPPQTSLLKAAAQRGLQTQNGIAMLIYQAILADELYLERKLDRLALYKKVENIITDQIKEQSK